jgi:3,4-dihydroxy 2-butanone 4-phosphate synthase / GTP cyclohydrolase II
MTHALRGTLLRLAVRRMATAHGAFDVHVCRNLFTRATVLAVTRGQLEGSTPVLARVHSSCVTSEAWGSRDCDCAEQLDAALAAIARAGRGVVFYLMQEGRGAGFAAKARDRMLVQASGERLTTFEAYAQMGLDRDHRSYDEVAFARRLLGITAPLTVMTSNPEKLGELARAGVPIAGTVSLQQAASPFNLHYLAAKAPSGGVPTRDGEPATAAALPEPVTCFEPRTLEGAPHLTAVASYLVPIAVPSPDPATGDGPHWFRLHAYFDAATGCDRVVLRYGRNGAVAPLVRMQRERLLERLPLAAGDDERRRWQATVRAFVRHGAGYAVLRVADACEDEGQTPGPDETGCWLLAHHVRAARARPLIDGPRASDADRVLARALARCGVEAEPALVLRVA